MNRIVVRVKQVIQFVASQLSLQHEQASEASVTISCNAIQAVAQAQLSFTFAAPLGDANAAKLCNEKYTELLIVAIEKQAVILRHSQPQDGASNCEIQRTVLSIAGVPANIIIIIAAQFT